MKILSPAGDMQSLKMAVYNGANEVYLGVRDFNARNNIAGFDFEQLKEAVKFAHIFGVRVFLTTNILFKNDEMQSALDLIVDANNIGVDAFIIQDLGLASLVNKYYPNIEMHASTQLGVHNLEGVKEIEKFGFKRVCLARETSLDEIERIHRNSNIEIEFFVQGALCVSFSGNCYLSSYLFDASGNRGKCKQLCRLPYTLEFNGKKIKEGFLLSAKDFNMLNKLKELQKAGVCSLKIEGRARRPYYVAVATKVYREVLDGKIANEEELNLAFTRGYTEGYFNGNSGIISNKQNHTGIEIGTVEKVNIGKKFNEIFISSNRDLTPKSAFKFFRNDEEIATISAFDLSKVEDLWKITSTQKVNKGDKVNLISDNMLETNALSFKKKRDIFVEITALADERMFAKTKVDEKEILFYGDICEQAKNSPLSIKDFEDCFNKNEFFNCEIKLQIGDIFMPKSKLNEFRRKFFDSIVQVLTKINNPILQKTDINQEILKVQEFSNFEVVENFRASNFKNLIFSPECYTQEKVHSFIKECLKENKKPWLVLPNFATMKDIEILKDIVSKTNISVIVNNVYALDFKTEKVAGYFMNVYNNHTANLLNLPFIRAENGNKSLAPYMTLRHCPMKEHVNSTCANCSFKNGFTYSLKNGTKLKLKRSKVDSCSFYLTD